MSMCHVSAISIFQLTKLSMDLIVREKKEVKGLFDISSSSQILVPHKFDD